MSAIALIPRISKLLGISQQQVTNTIALLDEGATIPFIARYRKEKTGSLDEVQIGDIADHYKKLQELLKRKASILESIEAQGKLTPELKEKIEACWESTELEDLYLPYKPKRKTRATVAKELGLEPLAQQLFTQEPGLQPETLARQFLTEGVADTAAALQGARDIIAEWISEDPACRDKVRHQFQKTGLIKTKVARGKEEEGAKYRDYFDFSEPLSKAPSHRVLAVRRGEEEGFLRLVLEPDNEQTLELLEEQVVKNHSPGAQQVKLALHDSYERLLLPGIETEFRQSTKERADAEAIAVFTENLRQLLLAAPLGQRRTLGVDPGYRTGCKLVVLDATGTLLHNTTIFPHTGDAHGAMATVRELVRQYELEAIAVGNGTAGKETLSMLRDQDYQRQVDIFMVNESGASIYSASATAREEFPDHDVTVRGAVSIGRRLMDPLAELVKIDPKSIGVGQYQHDVNQSRLKESLDRTVESCVNSVGINLNTASKHLLTYVSGLGPTLAQNIVEFRTQNGPFNSRLDLKKVPRLGDKAFEQAAGFLRIRNAKNPLDNTAVHPERYSLVEQMAKDHGCTVQELIAKSEMRKKIDLKKYVTAEAGLPTLQDILKELEKPGLDPRGEAKAFEFSKSINSIEDLQVGMVLQGIVTNITNFGAFVDIGVKQDGLVHISQLSDRFVSNPSEVVSLTQEVTVRVLEVDVPRKRINLSMKQEAGGEGARAPRTSRDRSAMQNGPGQKKAFEKKEEAPVSDLAAQLAGLFKK